MSVECRAQCLNINLPRQKNSFTFFHTFTSLVYLQIPFYSYIYFNNYPNNPYTQPQLFHEPNFSSFHVSSTFRFMQIATILQWNKRNKSNLELLSYNPICGEKNTASAQRTCSTFYCEMPPGYFVLLAYYTIFPCLTKTLYCHFNLSPLLQDVHICIDGYNIWVYIYYIIVANFITVNPFWRW